MQSQQNWKTKNIIALPKSFCKFDLYSITRMHSSRMRIIRCSGRLGWRFACGGVCLGEGSVCPKVGPAQGGVCLGCTPPGPRGRHTPAPVDRIIDTSLWKHYFSGTTVSDSKNIDLDKMTMKKYLFPTSLHTVTGSPSSLHWDVAKTVHNTKIGRFLNYNLKVVVVLLCLICCLWLVKNVCVAKMF